VIRGALILAICWAAMAVQPATSEALKVAGVAVVAAWLLLQPGILATALRQPALATSAVVVLLSSWFALEAAVWIGSAARSQGALVALALLVLAAAASSLADAQRQNVRRAAAALSALVSAYVLLQFAGVDPLTWQGSVERRPSATLSNATTLAGWLLLLVPATAAAALESARHRWIWIALLLLQLAALLASGTRSAVAALALAGIAGWICSEPRRRRWAVALLSAALIGVVLLAAWRPASLQDRAFLWRTGLAALVSPDALVDLRGEADGGNALRPWLGFGLDLQQPALTVASRFTPGARAEADGWVADRAHQAVVDRALEMGLAGLVASLLLVAAVLRALRIGWRSGDARRRREALVLGIALAAWMLHLQTSFGLTGDRTLAWVWIGMALALGKREPARADAAERTSDRAATSNGWLIWSQRALGIVSGAALLYAALGASGHLSPELTARIAPALQAEREYASGQVAYAQAMAATGVSATRNMTAAAAAFERAADLRRHDRDAALAAASARIEAAALRASADDLAKARSWADAAARLAPGDPRLMPLQQRIAAVAARLDAAAPERLPE
jgi:hypothetical protein